jgi:hypothetical protein
MGGNFPIRVGKCRGKHGFSRGSIFHRDVFFLCSKYLFHHLSPWFLSSRRLIDLSNSQSSAVTTRPRAVKSLDQM